MLSLSSFTAAWPCLKLNWRTGLQCLQSFPYSFQMLPTSMVQAAGSVDFMDPKKVRSFLVTVVEVGGRLKLINDGLKFSAFQAHYKRKHCCSCIFLLFLAPFLHFEPKPRDRLIRYQCHKDLSNRFNHQSHSSRRGVHMWPWILTCSPWCKSFSTSARSTRHSNAVLICSRLGPRKAWYALDFRWVKINYESETILGHQNSPIVVLR